MNKYVFAFLFPLFLGAQSIYEEVPLLFEQKQYVKAEDVAKFHVSKNPNDLKAIEL